MSDQQPESQEEKVEENVEQEAEETQAEEQNETETEQPEVKTGANCSNCDGTGLADKKTMGEMASELCKPCEGSGKI